MGCSSSYHANVLFLSGCSSVQQTSNSSLRCGWRCSDEQNFFLILLLFFIFMFITAASDHYLIGNNITVAVLGIVIPIGEYTLTIHIVFALCLPASPSFACIKHSANCLCVWRFVSLAACCIILYVYAWMTRIFSIKDVKHIQNYWIFASFSTRQ